MIEYPKHIQVDGITFEARDAAHEKAMRGGAVDPSAALPPDYPKAAQKALEAQQAAPKATPAKASRKK